MRIEGWPLRLWLHYRWGRLLGWLGRLRRAFTDTRPPPKFCRSCGAGIVEKMTITGYDDQTGEATGYPAPWCPNHGMVRRDAALPPLERD